MGSYRVDVSAEARAQVRQLPEQTEARRIRVEGWRIIYAVEEAFQRVLVLAIRKRPPYRYEDLERLLDELS